MSRNNSNYIVLTKPEQRFLKKLRHKKQIPLPNEMKHLADFDLIKINYSKELCKGVPVPDGTCSLSSGYERYLCQTRELFFTGKLPVILSVLALVKSFQAKILWLLQELARLLRLAAQLFV